VGIHGQKERPGNLFLFAVLADGLSDGQDMGFVDSSKDDPRCPEVPKDTRCAGTVGSGRPE
jgi:hypothetical protein